MLLNKTTLNILVIYYFIFTFYFYRKLEWYSLILNQTTSNRKFLSVDCENLVKILQMISGFILVFHSCFFPHILILFPMLFISINY